MVFKRGRRQSGKRVTYFKRKGQRRMFRRSFTHPVYKVTRTFGGTVSINALAMSGMTSQWANAGGLGITGFFSLDQLPNYTEFTALFNQYRIRKVKTVWTFSVNSNGYADTGGQAFVYVVKDRSDGTPLTSTSALLQYSSLKRRSLFKPVVMTFYPKPSINLGTTIGEGTSLRSDWINTRDYDVPHYGMKYGVEVLGNSDNKVIGTLSILHTFYLEFRNVH